MDRRERKNEKENHAKRQQASEEKQPGYGNKKLEGPNRPST